MKQTLREVSTAEPKPGSSPPTSSRLLWGYFFAFLGTVLFSTKAIFVKLAYQPRDGLGVNELDAITIMVMRLGFAIPAYAFIFYWAIRKSQKAGRDLPDKRAMLKATALGVIGYYVCAWLDRA